MGYLAKLVNIENIDMKEINKCRNCNKELKSPKAKFCSKECRKESFRQNNVEGVKSQFISGILSIFSS